MTTSTRSTRTTLLLPRRWSSAPESHGRHRFPLPAVAVLLKPCPAGLENRSKSTARLGRIIAGRAAVLSQRRFMSVSSPPRGRGRLAGELGDRATPRGGCGVPSVSPPSRGLDGQVQGGNSRLIQGRHDPPAGCQGCSAGCQECPERSIRGKSGPWFPHGSGVFLPSVSRLVTPTVRRRSLRM